MSVLVHESAIYPSENFWFNRANGARCITGTTTGTTSSVLLLNIPTTLNTITSNLGAGTYIIFGSFQWTIADAVSAIMRGYLRDSVSGAIAQCDVVSVVAGSYSSSCVITVTTTTNVVLDQFVTTTSNGNTYCKAQWSVIFFPSNP